MNKTLICILCPQGCHLETTLEDGQLLSLSGNNCPRGAEYAQQELVNPQRMLTATVMALGLPLKLIPVRTSKPLPKAKIPEAMQAIHALVITKPVFIGEVLVKNFLDLELDLIATRSCP